MTQLDEHEDGRGVYASREARRIDDDGVQLGSRSVGGGEKALPEVAGIEERERAVEPEQDDPGRSPRVWIEAQVVETAHIRLCAEQLDVGPGRDLDETGERE